MQFSTYTNKYQTNSFYIGVIRAAVEEYRRKHGAHGDVTVAATHISSGDFTAQGHAESALDGVIVEIERIAGRLVREQNERHEKIEHLRAELAVGKISEDEFISEMGFV